MEWLKGGRLFWKIKNINNFFFCVVCCLYLELEISLVLWFEELEFCGFVFVNILSYMWFYIIFFGEWCIKLWFFLNYLVVVLNLIFVKGVIKERDILL